MLWSHLRNLCTDLVTLLEGKKLLGKFGHYIAGRYEGVSIISGTGAVICKAVVVARCKSE
jgi:hypothetical protein